MTDQPITVSWADHSVKLSRWAQLYTPESHFCTLLMVRMLEEPFTLFTNRSLNTFVFRPRPSNIIRCLYRQKISDDCSDLHWKLTVERAETVLSSGPCSIVDDTPGNTCNAVALLFPWLSHWQFMWQKTSAGLSMACMKCYTYRLKWEQQCTCTCQHRSNNL